MFLKARTFNCIVSLCQPLLQAGHVVIWSRDTLQELFSAFGCQITRNGWSFFLIKFVEEGWDITFPLRILDGLTHTSTHGVTYEIPEFGARLFIPSGNHQSEKPSSPSWLSASAET